MSGDAFVGNIGQRALYDFTAIGDVVNTASRLQGKAAGGEIVLSERVAAGLPGAVGTRVELDLKGKAQAGGRLPGPRHPGGSGVNWKPCSRSPGASATTVPSVSWSPGSTSSPDSTA